jgi:ribosomal protein S27E
MNIALTCPQCGAEADFSEESSVFRCDFCGSTLKPTGLRDVQSFFLKPRITQEQVVKVLMRTLCKKFGQRGLKVLFSQLFYVPYWRVKGMIFQWVFGRKYSGSLDMSWEDFKTLYSVTWEHTFAGFNDTEFPIHTLGVRTQVLRIWPFNKENIGSHALFLKQSVSLNQVIDKAMNSLGSRIDSSSATIEMSKTELIGEKYSVVYSPFYALTVTDGKQEVLIVVDALSQKAMKSNLKISSLTDEAKTYQPLGFLPFKCPNCGHNFPFNTTAIVHLCHTCGRAWIEGAGRYHELFYHVLSPDDSALKSAVFLPFWKLHVQISALEKQYTSLKDFYSLFPLPRVMDEKELKEKVIYFFIPAFKIKDAKVVDKFASWLTHTQPDFINPEGEGHNEFRSVDVWLSLHEAKEMAHVLLYSLTPKLNKRTKRIIKNAHLCFLDSLLIWLPFTEQGIYLRELHTDFGIQKNAINLD